MSPEVLRAESTLTDRYQTTIPQDIRKALGLSKRDRIAYKLSSDGAVSISRASSEDEADPVIDKFLDFLADSMVANPESIAPLTSAMRDRVSPLVEGVEYDIDAPLLDEDEQACPITQS